MARAVRTIELQHDGHPCHKGLLVLDAGIRLVFIVRPSGSIDMTSLRVWTNCPPDGLQSDRFRRHTFWAADGSDDGQLNVNADWQAYVDVGRPGAFEFFLEFLKLEDGTMISMPPIDGRREQDFTVEPAGTSPTAVRPPLHSRRGPLVRFIVQPELLVRVSYPAPVARNAPLCFEDADVDVRRRHELKADGVGSHVPLTSSDKLDAACEGMATDDWATGDSDSDDTDDVIVVDDLMSSEDDADLGASISDRDANDVNAHAETQPLQRRESPASMQRPIFIPGLALQPGHGYDLQWMDLPLPLDGICLQTQMTRCLGPIDSWLRYTDLHTAATAAGLPGVPSVPVGEPVPPGWDGRVVAGTLAEAIACKYNFLHFTPVQRLGGSRSCYSLRDQLSLDWDTFSANVGVQAAAAAAIREMPWISSDRLKQTDAAEYRVWSHPFVEGAKMSALAEVIGALEANHGVLSMVDVVLNHTSTDSHWLTSHPEAGYNLTNSPHLRAAFELDECILRVSKAVVDGRVMGVSSLMSDAASVNTVIDLLTHHEGLGLPAARLWEYYVADVKAFLALSCLRLHGVAVDRTDVEFVDAFDEFQCESGKYSSQQRALQRRVEIACSQHPTATSVLSEFFSNGYEKGYGEGCVAVSDAEIEVLARRLSEQPSSLPRDKTLQYIRERNTLWRATSLNSDEHSAGETTPIATPVSTHSDDVSWNPGLSPTGESQRDQQHIGILSHDNERAFDAGRSYHFSPTCTQTSRVQGDGENSQNTSRREKSSSLSSSSAWDTFKGAVFNDGTGGRHSVHINFDAAVAALNTLSGVRIRLGSVDVHSEIPTALEPASLGMMPTLTLLKRLADAINLPLYRRYDADMASALAAVRGTAQYQWLSVYQGRQSLNADLPLVNSYFTRVQTGKTASPGGEAMTTHVLACNGFIWNGDPEIDFTLPIDASAAYSDIVRAGTAETEFVKRQVSGAPAGCMVASSASADAASASPTLQSAAFPGSQLMEQSKATIDAVIECYARADWTALDLMIDTDQWQQSASIDLGRHVSPTGAAGQQSSGPQFISSRLVSPSAVKRETVLHLDPLIVRIPLCTASTPYMRRDIVIWGDCVKLRWGLQPADSPWLWSHMRTYIRRMARMFHGVRIDNAHGTPLHVAAAMIDEARCIRPALYVNAELFTGSPDRDIEYTSRLGINSLVREAMQASDPRDLARMAHSYGGSPLASLRPPMRGGTAAARVEAIALRSAVGVRGSSNAESGFISPPLSGDVIMTLRNLLPSASSNSLVSAGDGSQHQSSIPAFFDFLNGFAVGGVGKGQASKTSMRHHGRFDGSISSLSIIDQAFASPSARSVRVEDSITAASLQDGVPAHVVLMHAGQTPVAELLPSPLPALFFDCTHDNPTPAEKRHPVDVLAGMAIASVSACSSGSVRGFDILVPENISVVFDHRTYLDCPSRLRNVLQAWASDVSGATLSETSEDISGADVPCGPFGFRFAADLSVGVRKVRRRLNSLKQEFAARGMSELHIQADSAPHGADIVTLLRSHPSLPTGYLTICRTAFTRFAGDARYNSGPLPDIRVEGTVADVLMSASLYVPSQEVKVHAPKGPLQIPVPLFDEKHPVQQLLRGDVEVVDDLPALVGALPQGEAQHWQQGRMSGFPVDDHQWFADQTRINGLACELIYVDNAQRQREQQHQSAFDSQSASLGLASFIEQPADDVTGTPCTLIRLDPDRFLPGSVLVVRVRCPRNVAIRMGQSGAVGNEKIISMQNTQSGHQHLRRPSAVSLRLNGDIAISSPQQLRTSASFVRVQPQHSIRLNTLYGPSLSQLRAALADNAAVTLLDINELLYRCEPEERAASQGARGLYNVPDLGPLPWAGVAGVIPALRHCRRWNDMGHPLLENIRKGPWLMEYTLNRLLSNKALSGVLEWLSRHFAVLRGMPPGLRPQGFDRIMGAVFHMAISAAVMRMRGLLLPSEHVHSQHYVISVMRNLAEATGSIVDSAYYHGHSSDCDVDSVVPILEHGETAQIVQQNPQEPNGGPLSSNGQSVEANEGRMDPSAPLPFITALAMTSVMLIGCVSSSPLLGVPLIESTTDGSLGPVYSSLAAGLDHFATGYMRSWGRDTFISLRGLLLVTGRFDEARTTIMAFATVLRHGLVPNLMDGGNNPRFNCRDAAWWFLQAVQDYCQIAPGGNRVLIARVHRRYPSDVSAEYDGNGKYTGSLPTECCLGDIVQEIMQKHASGIDFREWNAGSGIDSRMREHGFNVTARLDFATGFVHGGNSMNCGTWMDKMGSALGLNDGEPATPRDGAAVEITGLVYSTVKWLAGLAKDHSDLFPHTGVKHPDSQAAWTYNTWAKVLRENFERAYWVPEYPEGDGSFIVKSEYVHRRGIYKDTYLSSAGFSDFQLRPNFLVAIALAPDLFLMERADAALAMAERQLLGNQQIGVKTLDPADWAYRPNYDNGAQGDKATACGWNYHQGPEWLWPYGYYLRARMHFPPSALRSPTGNKWLSWSVMRRWTYARVSLQRRHMETNTTGGLPELTNASGAFCKDSCLVQAWSSGTILDALFDLHILHTAGT